MNWNEEFEDSDEVDTRPCPHCKTEIYDEAEQCPHCGEYITVDTSPFASKPAWVRGLFLMIIVLLTIVFTLSSLGLF